MSMRARSLRRQTPDADARYARMSAPVLPTRDYVCACGSVVCRQEIVQRHVRHEEIRWWGMVGGGGATRVGRNGSARATGAVPDKPARQWKVACVVHDEHAARCGAVR